MKGRTVLRRACQVIALYSLFVFCGETLAEDEPQIVGDILKLLSETLTNNALENESVDRQTENLNANDEPDWMQNTESYLAWLRSPSSDACHNDIQHGCGLGIDKSTDDLRDSTMHTLSGIGKDTADAINERSDGGMTADELERYMTQFSSLLMKMSQNLPKSTATSNSAAADLSKTSRMLRQEPDSEDNMRRMEGKQSPSWMSPEEFKAWVEWLYRKRTATKTMTLTTTTKSTTTTTATTTKSTTTTTTTTTKSTTATTKKWKLWEHDKARQLQTGGGPLALINMLNDPMFMQNVPQQYQNVLSELQQVLTQRTIPLANMDATGRGLFESLTTMLGSLHELARGELTPGDLPADLTPATFDMLESWLEWLHQKKTATTTSTWMTLVTPTTTKKRTTTASMATLSTPTTTTKRTTTASMATLSTPTTTTKCMSCDTDDENMRRLEAQAQE